MFEQKRFKPQKSNTKKREERKRATSKTQERKERGEREKKRKEKKRKEKIRKDKKRKKKVGSVLYKIIFVFTCFFFLLWIWGFPLAFRSQKQLRSSNIVSKSRLHIDPS